MLEIGATYRRLRRHLSNVELISAGAMVASYMGEPTLAHQLELVCVRKTSEDRGH